MKTSKPMKITWSIALAAACFALGEQECSAQLNEKKVERKASGTYEGRLYGGVKVYTDPNPMFSYTGNPADASGEAKVPIGKKRPSSTTVDDELPEGGPAVTTGKESKSKVARNGKKVKLAAKQGVATATGDMFHDPISNGTAKGVTKQKGKKWNLDANLAGSRAEGDGTASYTTKAEGVN